MPWVGYRPCFVRVKRFLGGFSAKASLDLVVLATNERWQVPNTDAANSSTCSSWIACVSPKPGHTLAGSFVYHAGDEAPTSVPGGVEPSAGVRRP